MHMFSHHRKYLKIDAFTQNTFSYNKTTIEAVLECPNLQDLKASQIKDSYTEKRMQ